MSHAYWFVAGGMNVTLTVVFLCGRPPFPGVSSHFLWIALVSLDMTEAGIT